MTSSPSPPQDAHHFRGTTLTPESPKPIHYPSPSNIPILEKQMDPLLGEPALRLGTPASYPYPQQIQTPSAHSSNSYYADANQNPQNAPAPASVAQVDSAAGSAMASQLPRDVLYGGGVQAQDTSAIHSFSQQPPASFSDAAHAPAPENRSAFQDNRSAFPNFQAQAQAQSPSLVTSVDVQALLDQLSTPAGGAASSQRAPPAVPAQPTQQNNSNVSSLPAAPNLPPRPPPQEKPSTHPNYNPNDDIRSFHPHSGHRGSTTQLQPLNMRGGGGSDKAMSPTSAGPNVTSFSQRQPQDFSRSGSLGDDEDSRWPPEVNKKYEEFLEQERGFVTDGRWDRFPPGSRLFIGNLPTEKVTKRDIFHRFHRHGNLAQISIKQAYGFVQFIDSESCTRALRAEQGQQVRGRKMHLEISKPQRNTKKAEPERNAGGGGRRRSRSPDYSPRFNNRNANPVSPRDNRRGFRDDYRGTRSPSPRRGQGYRNRSPDRYGRPRSRSPRRYRSPSPPPRRASTPELPLPFRAPQQIPDVQILVLNETLPSEFIRWVEDTFQRASLRCDVLIMRSLNEKAVMNRQIVEGVLAIVRLNTNSLQRGRVQLQIFDRRGGDGNVKFDAFDDVDTSTAVALIVQAKQKNSNVPLQQPTIPTHVQPYGTPTSNPANLTNFISNLDPASLSQLLGAMSGNNAPQMQQQAAPAGISPEIARLLSAVSNPAAASSYNPPTLPTQYQAPPPYQNVAYGQQFGNQGSQPATPPVHTPSGGPSKVPDMAEIMAQLAKYQR